MAHYLFDKKKQKQKKKKKKKKKKHKYSFWKSGHPFLISFTQ